MCKAAVGGIRFIKNFSLMVVDDKMDKSIAYKLGGLYGGIIKTDLHIQPEVSLTLGNGEVNINTSIDNYVDSQGAETITPLPNLPVYGNMPAKAATRYFENVSIPIAAQVSGATTVSDLANKLWCDRSKLYRKFSGEDISNLFEGEGASEDDPLKSVEDPLSRDVIRIVREEGYLNSPTDELSESKFNVLKYMKDLFDYKYATHVLRKCEELYENKKERLVHAADILGQTTKTVVNKVKSYYAEKYYSLLHPRGLEPSDKEDVKNESSTGKAAREEQEEFEKRASLRQETAGL